jgi:pilus assembly protein CpaF
MSLLKRIEQGQGGGVKTPEQPAIAPQTPPSDASRLSSLQARRVSAPSTTPQAGSYFDLKTRVQNRLLSELDPSMDIAKTDDVRKTIQGLF